MPFHRFLDPTYYLSGGSFPGTINGATYDRINVISGGTGASGSALADGAKASGPNAGTYFVAFGEDARSLHANRGFRALGENTDYLDNLFHRDLAIPTSTDTASGHGGSASKQLNGSTNPIYVSSSGGTNIKELFYVVDPANDSPIFVNGNRVVAISISGAAIGSGFSNANPLTVNFNEIIPDAQAFRVCYGIRGNLATLPENALTLMDIVRAAMVIAANDLEVDDSPWSSATLGDINSKTGGIGAANLLHEALNSINTRLEKLRTFTGTITDGVTSTGGDHQATSIDSLITTATATMKSGKYVMKEGAYTISATPASWDVSMEIACVTDDNVSGDTAITIQAPRAANLEIPSQTTVYLDGIAIRSASTSARYEVTSGALYVGSKRKRGRIDGGALYLNLTGGTVDLDDVEFLNNSTLQINYSVEITGSGRVRARGCVFEDPPSSAPAAAASVYIHDVTSNTTMVFEDCFFEGEGAIDALRLSNVHPQSIIFRNCYFFTEEGWAVNSDDVSNVLFEKCTFFGDQGQAARLVDSGATLSNCKFEAGTAAGITNPQLLVGYGTSTVPLVIENCTATYSSANVIDGAPTKPIVELGGEGAVVGGGRMEVDGLLVEAGSSVTEVHSAATLIMWEHIVTSMAPNVYRDVTIDMKGVETNSAAPSSLIGGLLVLGALVEAGNNGSTNTKAIIENLKLINVKEPATLIGRTLMYLEDCTVHNLEIDGYTTGGANNFSGQFLRIGNTDVYGLYLCEEHGIKTSGYHVFLDANSRILGGRTHNRGKVTGGFVFPTGNYTEIRDFWMVHDGNYSGASLVGGVGATESHFTVDGCLIYVNGTCSNEIMELADLQYVCVYDTIMYWENVGGGSMVRGNASNSVFVGNVLHSSTVTPPGEGVTGFPTTFADLNYIIASSTLPMPTY